MKNDPNMTMNWLASVMKADIAKINSGSYDQDGEKLKQAAYKNMIHLANVSAQHVRLYNPLRIATAHSGDMPIVFDPTIGMDGFDPEKKKGEK